MVSFWMCATCRSTSSSALRRSAAQPRVVDRPRCRGARERQQLGGDFADRVVLFDQQRRHVAVAGVGHQRKERFLLEPEVALDVLFQRARELADQGPPAPAS